MFSLIKYEYIFNFCLSHLKNTECVS
uniref:Uncharacterized protein n=1 Tax=Anguilla anguilla TaxID=7936 RepID=A0A0E9UAD6_ANGAN